MQNQHRKNSNHSGFSTDTEEEKNSFENPPDIGAFREVDLSVDDKSSQQEMEETNSFVLENEDEPVNSSTSEEEEPFEEEDEENQENAEPVDQKSESENEGYFTFQLINFHALGSEKVLSPWRRLGNFKFRFLIFPKGNGTPHDLSLYLETCPLARRKLPLMNQAVKFCLILVNQKDAQKNIAKYADHKFTIAERDWGFREFVKLELINRPEEGFLVNDCLLFTAQVTLVSEWELDNPVVDYNSRKATGYVGLKNQGATCYMNSLLQTLFHLGEFRRAVYRMPVLDSSSDKSPDLLTYALQRVFYDLQYCPTVVKTKRLTDSFGWDNVDAFTQHDVQELNRILCDALEEKMKREEGVDGENIIRRLFEGKILNYIKCIHVPYESSHIETFYDLSLNVRGCADIYDSFEKYTEVEIMDGDNKYRAEGYQELQAAKKGSVFITLPPVLQLHLKRFEYDFAHDMMVKINDHYKFYETIHLNSFVSREESMEPCNVDYTYDLHAVLVHMGDIYGGHYYAFIRPNLLQDPDGWYKFDDDLVFKSDRHQAIEENFGVGGQKVAPEEEKEQEERDRKLRTLNGLTPPELQPPRSRQSMVRRFANAYMLQYIRRDKIQEYLTPLQDTEVPGELIERLEREKEEEALRKKERMEAHLYCTFMVVTDNDLLQYRGTDLLPRSALYKLKMRKSTTLKELKDVLLSRGLIKDPSMIRIWRCFQRDNDTIRTQFLLAGGRENSSVLEDPGYERSDGTWEARVLDESLVPIYVEDLLLNDGKSDRMRVLSLPKSLNPSIADDELLLFFKFYTPFPNADYRMIGKQIMKQNDVMADVLAVIKEMMGESILNQEMLLFEEISPRNVQKLDDMSRTLKSYKIGCGDIIVIQPVPLPWEHEQVKQMIDSGARYLPTVLDFFEYLMKRVDVEIRNILEPHKPGVILDVMISDTYEQLRDRFCKLSRVGIDPEYIRFFPMDPYRMQPRSFPFTFSERTENFQDWIRSFAVRTPPSRVLYYQRLAHAAVQYDEKDEYTVIYREDSGRCLKEDESFTDIQEYLFSTRDQVLKETSCGNGIESCVKSHRTNILSILLPHHSKVSNLLQRIRELLDLAVEIELRLILVQDHRIVRYCLPHEEIPEWRPGTGMMMRVEPCEREIKDSTWVSVVHVTKDHKQLGGYDIFGVPFLLQVPQSGETIEELRRRLARTLQVKEEETESWKLHEIQGDNLRSLPSDPQVVWIPHFPVQGNVFTYSLAIERKNASKRVHLSSKAIGDKPLKIRG
ncbi:hypothetical protein GpartN1_g2270.t1 [Galdieria partita]|uniref:ubiquitinyl hydrolase 1 n=1 Tax=Galdieria partita TaxID=83374 RepID=A0A9C7UP21_9RHOD|nr:hypothetical protein GpartN1_g2270.t1 [Galdieria partita]